MEYTQEEQFEIQGFRNGYYIANEAPTLHNLILNLNHHPAYLRGLRKGMEQQKKDREFIFSTPNSLEQRRAKLRQISEQEKDREQDELER